MKSFLRIGSRGSDLALWQANYLKDQLQNHGISSEIIVILTKGDKIQDLSFDKIEGKGFFTKEIEDSLLNDEIDIAVHSMKDMPTSQPEGLTLTAVSYREDPSDCLLISKDCYDQSQDFRLKDNTVIGTSSSRRKSLITNLRQNIQIKDIRGNVPTRIQKLRNGDFGAIILAQAGLNRLKLDVSDLHVVTLNPKEFVPAPAQGVLAYQTHRDDFETRKVMKLIHDSEVAQITNIERTVLKLMGGGCHLPLGVYCMKDKSGNFHVHAALGNTNDGSLKKVSLSQSTSSQLGEKIHQLLIND